MRDAANVFSETDRDARGVERLETPSVKVGWLQQSGPAVLAELVRYYNPLFLLVFLVRWALDHLRVAFLERSVSAGFRQLVGELRAVTSGKTRKRLPAILEPLTILLRSETAAVADYVSDHRQAIVHSIEACGGVLLRGFAIPDENAASSVLRALRLEPVEYGLSEENGNFRSSVNEFFGRNSPFSTADAGPLAGIRGHAARAQERLGLSWGRPWMGAGHFGYHNEASYGNCSLGPSRRYMFPDFLVFYCVEPARRGGITVISDCRRVLTRVRRGILEKQTYQGLFETRPGSRTFGPIKVATRVYKGRDEMSDEEWEGEQCPITVEHPHTKDVSFVNHLAENGMFRPHRHFGDGTVLSDADYFHIWKAHVLETTFFSWKKGDLLILDNRLVAHSGTAFNREAGQKRELRVAVVNAMQG